MSYVYLSCNHRSVNYMYIHVHHVYTSVKHECNKAKIWQNLQVPASGAYDVSESEVQANLK